MATFTESSIEKYKNQIFGYKQEVREKFALIRSQLSLIEKEKQEELDKLLLKFDQPNTTTGYDSLTQDVTLCWNEHAIDSMSSFCKIEIKPLLNILNPTWSSAPKGSQKDQIFRPHGLTIDKETKTIYVADYFNKRIQVFDLNGGYRKSIFHPDILNHHRILSVSNFLYVTDPINKQIYKINKENYEVVLSEELEYCPGGLDVLNYRTYINDTDPPFRIFVYDTDLYKEGQIELKASTSNEAKTVYLLDIKFAHNVIYTLFKNAPYRVSLFDLNGNVLSSLIPLSLVNKAFYFCIDDHENILISSWQDNQVLVFSKDGELKSRIGNILEGEYNSMVEPRGLDILNSGVLVICDNNQSACLYRYEYL